MGMPPFDALVLHVIQDLLLGCLLLKALTILCKCSNQSLLQHEFLCTQWLLCHKHAQLPLGCLCWSTKYAIQRLMNQRSILIYLLCVYIYAMMVCGDLTYCRFQGRDICFQKPFLFLLPIYHCGGACKTFTMC